MVKQPYFRWMKFHIAITSWEKVQTPININGVDYYATQIEARTPEAYEREVDESNYSEFEEMQREAFQKAKAWEAILEKTRVGEFPFVFPQIRCIG